jgi:hypothetical protein
MWSTQSRDAAGRQLESWLSAWGVLGHSVGLKSPTETLNPGFTIPQLLILQQLACETVQNTAIRTLILIAMAQRLSLNPNMHLQ